MCAKPTDSSNIDIDTLRQQFEKLRNGLGDVTDKLGDSTHAALDQISDYLKGDKMSSHLDNVESHLDNLGARLKDSSKEAMARVEDQVSDKPFIALAIAFGVGLLASSLIRRN